MQYPEDELSRAWLETLTRRIFLQAKWLDQAACAGYKNPNAFFPAAGEQQSEAKEICASCPVWFECLEHSVHHHENFGTWGGLTERDRRRLPKGKKLSDVTGLCKKCGLIRIFVDRKCERCNSRLKKPGRVLLPT